MRLDVSYWKIPKGTEYLVGGHSISDPVYRATISEDLYMEVQHPTARPKIEALYGNFVWVNEDGCLCMAKADTITFIESVI